MLAPAATLLVWTLLDLLRTGKATAVGAATAIVVGLVAVTPAAGFVSPSLRPPHRGACRLPQLLRPPLAGEDPAGRQPGRLRRPRGRGDHRGPPHRHLRRESLERGGGRPPLRQSRAARDPGGGGPGRRRVLRLGNLRPPQAGGPPHPLAGRPQGGRGGPGRDPARRGGLHLGRGAILVLSEKAPAVPSLRPQGGEA